MSTPTRANAAEAARPTVEVRVDGQLLRRIAAGAAEMLIARGWAEWFGTGRAATCNLQRVLPFPLSPDGAARMALARCVATGPSATAMVRCWATRSLTGSTFPLHT